MRPEFRSAIKADLTDISGFSQQALEQGKLGLSLVRELRVQAESRPDPWRPFCERSCTVPRGRRRSN
jgi:hypothetical protein